MRLHQRVVGTRLLHQLPVARLEGIFAGIDQPLGEAQLVGVSARRVFAHQQQGVGIEQRHHHDGAPVAAAHPLAAREAVEASAPQKSAGTVYRDPNRGPDETMDRDWPRGFAMISETRTVTLRPGESTIRFEGVSEGMVAVTAIVTGLPPALASRLPYLNRATA